MKSLVLSFVLAFPAIAAAQNLDSPKPAPSTKLEAFSARTGIVVVKGYTELGKISGVGGVLTISVREFRDASNPKIAMYGVAFEVKETSRLERQNTSFIDEDEIDSLVKGLDYVQKINRSVTTLGNFEAEYRTKGDLEVSVFSTTRDEGIGLAITSGRIGKTVVYPKISDIERIRSLLDEAKKAITAAKSGRQV
jgi:hypothetical protein